MVLVPSKLKVANLTENFALCSLLSGLGNIMQQTNVMDVIEMSFIMKLGEKKMDIYL